jgi:4-amino-4-deoxy-L-arabinose transferase-like glycosyltransferase
VQGLSPVNSKSKITQVAAAVVVALAVISALIFTLAYPLPEVVSDARGYLETARNVAAGAGFTQDGVSPMLYRPPLFSGLLGGWFFLTGSHSPLSAAIFQSLVHGASVLVAFLLFLELARPAWAFAGAAWLAVNPLLVTRVAFVLQEPTILLFTTLAAWRSVRLIKASSAARALSAGIAWGLCMLAKVVAWFGPFLLLGMRMLPGRVAWVWKRRDAVILLLFWAAALAPWTARNYIHFSRLILVNSQGEGMLQWNVSHAEIPGEPPGSSFIEELSRKHLPPAERNARMWQYIMAHPEYFFVTRVLRNAVYFAAPPRDWWIARGQFAPGKHRTAFWILASLFHIPLYVLLLLRTCQWWRGRASADLGFLLLFYWVYWFQHAIIWGDPRFGLAVYPTLVAIALAAPARREGVPLPALFRHLTA